jgi:hypothetical protein
MKDKIRNYDLRLGFPQIAPMDAEGRNHRGAENNEGHKEFRTELRRKGEE